MCVFVCVCVCMYVRVCMYLRCAHHAVQEGGITDTGAAGPSMPMFVLLNMSMFVFSVIRETQDAGKVCSVP